MDKKSKISCTRKLGFSSGHRVMGHESKCATPHGHNYTVYLTAEGEKLDSIGRVIDFSIIKEKIGTWIDEHWDHTFLLYREDTLTHELLLKMPGSKPPYVCNFNPTAENMANYLLTVVAPQALKGTSITVTKVVLYETENCFAEAKLEITNGV